MHAFQKARNNRHYKYIYKGYTANDFHSNTPFL